jgi:hypothetical protein
VRKTLEQFDFTFQGPVKKQVIEHLGRLDFLHARETVVLLGPPGTGKTHLAIAVSIRACLAGHRVAFATATEWVARLAEAKRQNTLDLSRAACPSSRCSSSMRSATSRLSPKRSASCSASLYALRARQHDRHLQQAILGPGRDLRR